MNLSRFCFLALFVSLFFSCSTVEEILEERVPEFDLELSLTEIQLTGLSFSQAELAGELRIHNPNTFPVEIQNLAYELAIDNNAFLEQQSPEVRFIEAGENVNVQLNLSVSYDDLYENITFPDEQMDSPCTLSVSGSSLFPESVVKDISATVDGILPLIRKPRFDFEYVYVKDLGLMGASIISLMNVENPNDFPVTMNSFAGTLVVNDQRWADLKISEPQLLEPLKVKDLGFQFRLEFLSMGRTVRDLLSGEQELLYHFGGEAVLDAEHELMDIETLDLSFEGELDLIKPEDTVQGRHSSQKIEDSIEDNLLNLFGSYSR